MAFSRYFALLTITALLLTGGPVDAQNVKWLDLEGANSNYTPTNQSYNANNCNDVAVNNRNHDVYIAGEIVYPSYFGTTSYNPWSAPDGFIVRYDSAGTLIWSKQIPSSNLELTGIAVDSAGNSYICGQFQGNVDFGGGLIVSNYPGDFEFYVASYGPQGNFRWEHHHHPTAVFSSTGDMANDIAVDKNGFVYYTGSFRGTVTIANTFLYSVPYFFTMGLLVTKLDSLGNYLWAYGTINSAHQVVGTGISVDQQGNPFVTGYYNIDAVFSPTDSLNTVNSSETEAFIAKFNTAGAFQWARRIRGAVSNDIATDTTGSCYIVGHCVDSVYFGSQLVVFPAHQDERSLIAKYDGSGNYLWSAARDSSSGKGIVAAPDGSCFILAEVADYTVPFYSFELACKFDPTGAPVWEKKFPYIGGGSVFGTHNGIARDGCSIVVADSFWNNEPPDSNPYTPIQTKDIFVAKLGDSASVCCRSMKVDAVSFLDCEKGQMLALNGTYQSLHWSTGDTVSPILPLTAGMYYATASNQECRSSDSIYFTPAPGETPFYIPNAFTPNRDGLNESFGPVGLAPTSYTFRIFDRWGNLIFETTDVNQMWDGTYKNELVESDVYVWTIDYQTPCSGQDVIHKRGMVVIPGHKK